MKRLTIAISVLLVAVAALAAKQPITHETLWLMKRVGAPVLSPDGRWVVFSVVEPAQDHVFESSGERCDVVARQQTHRIHGEA